MDAMTIELTHHRNPGSVISSIRGWIEANPNDILQFFISGGSIQLSDLDPRLEGDAAIPRFNSGVTRFELVVNGGVRVEGRELKVGERVRITTGGKILWNP